jgi:hypothetical protein
MAPEIDATYRRIEKLLGVEFSAQLYETLDFVLEQLPPESQTRLAEQMGEAR